MATEPLQRFQVPDAIGYLEGWRAWSLARRPNRYGAGPRLMSVTHRAAHTGMPYAWKPREFGLAYCPMCGDDLPGQDCTCGFYSASSLYRLQRLGYHSYGRWPTVIRVIGRVANWGNVVPADFGCRAQKSYPLELYLPHEAWRLAEPLAETYGVPVKLQNVLRTAEKE
jgi:hypothetical protein